MALSLACHTEFYDQERGTGVVSVQTSRCWYKVAIYPNYVTVVGPGVEEEYDRDNGTLMEDLSFEGLALAAVLKFEETER